MFKPSMSKLVLTSLLTPPPLSYLMSCRLTIIAVVKKEITVISKRCKYYASSSPFNMSMIFPLLIINTYTLFLSKSVLTPPPSSLFLLPILSHYRILFNHYRCSQYIKKVFFSQSNDKYMYTVFV